MLGLTGTDDAPGTVLGAPGSADSASAADPAIVRDGDRLTAFTQSRGGGLELQTGRDGQWSGHATDLGGPTGGRFLGQPAAYGSAGGRIDVFVRGADGARLPAHPLRRPLGRLAGPRRQPRRRADRRLHRSRTSGRSTPPGPTARWPAAARTPAGARSAPRPDSPSTGRPSAVVDSAGRTHVAVRTADDAVWTRVEDAAGTWSDWSSLGGTVSGSPTLVATGGSVQLLVRASDYTLWRRTYDAAADSWGGWFAQPDYVSNTFDGAMGATAGDGGTVLAVSRGVGGTVRQSSFVTRVPGAS